MTLAFLGNLVNPALLGLGALAVSVPIIIHLLNKRKFKVVDWAAMDFIKQAEKLNRRRVQLEDLILLLLRCLAIFLLGLLLARPFLKSGFIGNLLSDARYERIFVLDDSPSMGARGEGGTAFAVAKRKLSDYLSALASEGSGDAATLYLTSNPRKPVFAGLPVKGGSLGEMLDDINELSPSDQPADYDEVFARVRSRVEEKSSSLNRMLFLVTDLRDKDWLATDETGSTTLSGLRAAAENLAGCFVLDFGSGDTGNLTVEKIEAQDKTLVGGVPTRFDVTVRNHGPKPARDVKVAFAAESSLPLEDRVAEIPAGGTASVPFTFAFARGEEDGEQGLAGRPASIRVSLSAEGDVLEADNERYYPGRVFTGIKTLIVDGDPGARYDRTESFFLRKALAPRGDMPSGVSPEMVGVEAFETTPLAPYQFLVLANAYRLTSLPERLDERRQELREWIAAGGGMLVALGEDVDEAFYNEELHRDGEGILPVRLTGLAGDETRESWANLHLTAANHPALRFFEGENNPLIEDVKFFRWWECEVPPDDESVTVLARFTDEEGAPAVIEKRIGDGRVIVIASSLQLDGSNWPQEFSFLVAAQELARYLARNDSAEGAMTVGEPIRQAVDLARFKLDLTVTDPEGLSTPLQARQPEDADPTDPVWQAEFAEMDRRGFYQVSLQPNGGGEPEQILFAANLEPDEGRLARVDPADFRAAVGESRIELGQAFPGSGQELRQASHEIWKPILFALAALLLVEQLYAWWLGRRRSGE